MITSKTNQSRCAYTLILFLLVAIVSPTLISANHHASADNSHLTERRPHRSLIAFQSSFQHPQSSSSSLIQKLPIVAASTALPSLFCSHDSVSVRHGRLPVSQINNCRTISLWRLLATPNNDDNSNDNSSGESDGKRKKRSFSIARAGGRSATSKTSKLGANETSSGLPPIIGNMLNGVKKIIYLIVAVQILQSLFGFLFGGGANDGSYVYYQSTVYETTSVAADGQVSRIRKESVKSNIPSLISGDRVIEDKNAAGGDSKSSYLLRGSPDDGV
mmetsp:Transcript_15674/g.18578  ORF Transcript_15674/g.18578 Transcript_15674/m.18578 type:complete len:274 (-) Transcript_15674:392-1213(-)